MTSHFDIGERFSEFLRVLFEQVGPEQMTEEAAIVVELAFISGASRALDDLRKAFDLSKDSVDEFGKPLLERAMIISGRMDEIEHERAAYADADEEESRDP